MLLLELGLELPEEDRLLELGLDRAVLDRELLIEGDLPVEELPGAICPEGGGEAAGGRVTDLELDEREVDGDVRVTGVEGRGETAGGRTEDLDDRVAVVGGVLGEVERATLDRFSDGVVLLRLLVLGLV